MKYRITYFQPPQVQVEYSSEDGLRKHNLMVRIDKKLDGSLPEGEELDNYILSFGPNLDDIPEDPYADVDWSTIEKLVELTTEEKNSQRKSEILLELSQIDMKSIRALRANDTETIAQYEAEAEQLRIEYRSLS
jgi:hypothetical protein